MHDLSLGFIGFGEAGFHLARGLHDAGLTSLAAYDIQSDAPGAGELIRQRARDSGTRLVASPRALAGESRVLFSTVTSASAQAAATQTVAYLEPHHTYADLNSVSPALKQQIGRIIAPSGSGFVEAAVMGPVPPHGHRVPILLGGPAARELADRLTPFGLRLEVLTDQIGPASAVKMCRSLVVKGLEALLFECVLGASRYDADARVFASLADTFPGVDWKALADYTTGRVAVHGERRAREMEEVAETLRAMGVEPIMASATARRQQWAAALGLRDRFGAEGPASYQDVLAEVANREGRDGDEG